MIGLLRNAANCTQKHYVAEEASDQQPGIAFHGEKYAPPKDNTHSQVSEHRSQKFHGATVTRILRRASAGDDPTDSPAA